MITDDEQVLQELRSVLDRLPRTLDCPPQLAQRVVERRSRGRARVTILLTIISVALLAAVVPVGTRLATSGSDAGGKPDSGTAALSRLDLSSLRLPDDGTVLPIGSRRPAIVLSGQTVGGARLDTRSWQGGPGVIFGYASWCAVCRNALASVSATLRAEHVPAVFLAYDAAGSTPAFLNTYGISFPVIDDQDRAVRFGGLPQLVVLDRQGRAAAGWSGYTQDELPNLQTALAQLDAEYSSTAAPPVPMTPDELAQMGNATDVLRGLTEGADIVAFGRSAGHPVSIVGVPRLTSALRARLLAALTPEQASWIRLIGLRYTRKQLDAMSNRLTQVFSELSNRTEHTATAVDYLRGVIDVYTPRSNSQFIAAMRALVPADMLDFHWGGVTFMPN